MFNNLRKWRIDHGLTLEEASALTGFHVSELSRIERGLRGVAPLRRVEIARALGAPLREVFPPAVAPTGQRHDVEAEAATA